VNTSAEASNWVVPGNSSLQILGKSSALREVVDINGVKVVTSSWSSLGNIDLRLVDICFRSEIERVGGWINDSSGCHTNVRVDINTSVQICGQERNVQVP